MAAFRIEGGRRLSGDITPQGAKNEALQVMCACLLTDEPVRIKNLPGISDVRTQARLLRGMGVSVVENAPGDLTLRATSLSMDYLLSEEYATLCGGTRGSVLLVGPLLARAGRAIVARPGGDKIGRRRLDAHLLGLRALGANVDHDTERGVFDIRAEKLRGQYILLPEASVTGTANVLMAATLAEGTTTIYNAACEPYVQQLCRLLLAMGARISGVGSNLLTVEGVDRLHGAEHTVQPDMIEVGSFIGMAAMCGDGVRIRDARRAQLGIIPATYRRMGIEVREEGSDIVVPEQRHYEMERTIDGQLLTLSDAPWPGLTPDLLSVMLVVATQAKGSALIHQKMFESRLFFVDRLIDMGAQVILCDPHRAVVIGHDRQLRLRAGRMTSPDIRAGIALLIACISAEGTSTIDNIGQIDRGYQNIEQRLNALGANIMRTE